MMGETYEQEGAFKENKKEDIVLRTRKRQLNFPACITRNDGLENLKHTWHIKGKRVTRKTASILPIELI